MVYVVTFYSTCSNLFVASRINLFIFRRPCFIHAVLLRPFVFILLTIYHFSIWIICIRLAFLTSSTTSLPSRISGILCFILHCIRVIILLSVLVISDFFPLSLCRPKVYSHYCFIVDSAGLGSFSPIAELLCFRPEGSSFVTLLIGRCSIFAQILESTHFCRHCRMR